MVQEYYKNKELEKGVVDSNEKDSIHKTTKLTEQDRKNGEFSNEGHSIL